MRKHEQREVVTSQRQVCVKLVCDACGKEAEHPEDELWTWGGAGSAAGKLDYHYSIDGEYEPERLDLCYECAEALADDIRARRWKAGVFDAV